MASLEQASEISGKTMLFRWTEGPTKGKTYEHVFHRDGTVEYHAAGAEEKGGRQQAKEKPPYAAVKVTDRYRTTSWRWPRVLSILTFVCRRYAAAA